MNFIDTIAESAKKEEKSLIDYITAPEEESQYLTDNMQGFAEDTAESLGLPEGSIKTKKDWDALNKSEEARLLQEEEGVVMSKAIEEAVKEGSSKKTSKNVLGLASLENKGIPYAASISANKNDFALSDANNLENLATPTEVAEKQMRAIGKHRVLEQAYAEIEDEISKMPAWKRTKKWVGDFVTSSPLLDPMTVNNAIKLIGLKNESGDIFGASDIYEGVQRLGKKATSSTYREVFMNYMNYIQGREDISEADYANIIKDIRKVWNENGVNIYVQEALLRNALDFSPALPDFNAALLIPTGVTTSKLLGKAGVSLSNGLYTSAGRYTALAGLEAIQFPFTNTVVNIAFKPIERVTAALTPSSKVAKIIDRAVKTNDRELLKRYAENLLGAPKNKDFVIKAAEKEGVLKYFVEPIADAVDNAKRSPANSREVLIAKIENSYRTRLNTAIEQAQKIENVTTAHIKKLSETVMDTLDMNNLIAAGRGRYGEKIVAITDMDSVLRSKEGNLVYAVKLVSDNDPVSAFQSVIKNGKDVGRQKAERFGQALAEAAKATGTDFGIDSTVEWVKLSQENGYWRPSLLIDTKKGVGNIFYDAWKEAGLIKQENYRPFLSGLATVTSNPSHIRALDVLRDVTAGVFKKAGDDAIGSFKALPKESRRAVQGLVDISTDYGAWYDPETLLAKGYNEGEVRSYMNFKMMNDLDEFVRNQGMRRELIQKGGKKVWFNGKAIDGVVRPVPRINTASDLISALKDKRVLVDTIEGTPYALTNTDKIKDLFNKGYILIEPSISPDSTVAAKSFYYLLNPQSTNINDLGAFVTTYVAGGRRFFGKNNSYVKQLVMSMTESGRRTIIGSQTFFTDLDSPGLQRTAQIVEEARQLWIKGDKQGCTNLIQSQGWQKAPFNDADSFFEYFSERGMDFENIDNALVVVKDGEVMSTYKEMLKKSNVDDLVGLEEMERFAKNSLFQAITNEAKVQRMKRTGRELLTWDFEKAQTVDFEHQMRYLVQDMVDSGVMGAYTDYVADHFAATFRDVIKDAGGMTHREMLIKGTPKTFGLSEADKKLVKQMITAQKNYAAIRGIPTETDRKVSEAFLGTMEWVGDKLSYVIPGEIEKVKHGVRVKWEQWREDLNPLLFLRTCVAHKMMGFFNVGQFFRQAAQDLSIIMMDKNALGLAADALQIEIIMMRSGGDLIKAQEFAKEVFKGNQELLNNALNIMDMGLFSHGTAGGMLETGQSVKGLLNKLSFAPFNAGEMHPRVLSGLTALKTKGLYGVRKSTEELLDAAVYGRSLFQNMDSTGLSRLQSSQVASTLLQFQTPAFRWMETVMFDKALTPWQRAKLGIGTALLVGGEGIIGVEGYTRLSNNVYRIFYDDRDNELPSTKESSVILDMFRKGIINEFFKDYTAGMNLTGPLEPNLDQTVDLATGILNLDLSNVSSVQLLGDAIEGIEEIYSGARKLFKGTGTEEDFRQFLERFPRYLPNSISRPWMAYNVYKTGEILNTKGELQERTNSMAQAVLEALGFNRMSKKEIYKAISENRYRKDILHNLEEEIYKALLNYSRYPSTENWDAVNVVLDSANVYPVEKARAYKEAWDRLPEAFRDKYTTLQFRQLMNSGMSGTNLIK